MRKPVTAADRLRHGVREREHRTGKRDAAVGRAPQQRGSGFAVARRGDDARQPFGDEACSGTCVLIGGGVVPLDVERLGAVGERVHRGPHRRLRRQVERQLGLVDDRRRMCAAPSAPHPPVGIADAEIVGPLGAGVRRRHRYERQCRARRDGLPEVDRAPAADGQHPVGAFRACDGLGYAIRGHLLPAGDRIDGKLDPTPARTCDEERRRNTRRRAYVRKATEPPLHDHDKRSRANATNSCATRVSARPLARTS